MTDSMDGTPVQPSLRGEYGNMALLLFLYFLQGVPMGLASAIPLYLASKGATFTDQAVFSFASWPYALKLLWAPLVDAVWTSRFRLGQRKSWIVPVQLVVGGVMIILSASVNSFFGGTAPEELADSKGGAAAGGDVAPIAVDVHGLTAAFFVLYALVATQDIAVDGWALTMLRKENVGYASTANSVGQLGGALVAFNLFLALDSADVSNSWVRQPFGLPPQPYGVVTMSGFMAFWGVVFLTSTVIVWVMKSEAAPTSSSGEGSHAHSVAIATSVTSPSNADMDLVGGLEGLAAAAVEAQGTGAGTDAGASAGAGALAAAPLSPAARRARAGSSGSATSLRRRLSGDRKKKRTNPSTAAVVPAVSAASDGSAHADAVSGDEVTSESAPLRSAVDGVSSSSGGDGSSSSSGSAPQSATQHSTSARAAVLSAYKDFWAILRLRSVLILCGMLLTMRAGFAAADNATVAVLQQERGIPKETFAALSAMSAPFQILLPLLIAKLTAGPRPLSLLLLAYPARIAVGLLQVAVIKYVLPDAHAHPWTATTVPGWIFGVMFLTNIISSSVSTLMFMSQISFFTRVSSLEPLIGGTYVTLLNTLANLGGMWAAPVALSTIDALSVRVCEQADTSTLGPWNASVATAAAQMSCKGAAAESACRQLGGACGAVRDGYTIAVLLGTTYSLLWFAYCRSKALKLQDEPSSAWRLTTLNSAQHHRATATATAAATPAAAAPASRRSLQAATSQHSNESI